MNVHVPYDGNVQMDLMQDQDDLMTEMPTLMDVPERIDWADPSELQMPEIHLGATR